MSGATRNLLGMKSRSSWARQEPSGAAVRAELGWRAEANMAMLTAIKNHSHLDCQIRGCTLERLHER